MSKIKVKKYNINKEKYLSQNSGVQFISIFSGCGGLDLGVTLNNFKVITSLDNNEDCLKTLSLNKVFNDTKHIFKDIRNLNSKEFSSILKKSNPNKLFMIGGPPCQPFSKAAYWQTNAKRKGKDSEKNMIDPYLNLINQIKPDGFILENVESILHPTNKSYLEYLINKIKMMGYYLNFQKLNAADFGVPQKRKRVFFIARLYTKPKEIKQTHGNEKAIKINKKLKKYERVIDWIHEFDNKKYEEANEKIEGKYKNDLENVISGKNYIYLTEKYNYKNPKFIAGKRYWTFLLKLHPEHPSNTIISSPGHWEGPFHWKNRRLRTKELAAIQSFPNDFKFYGSRRSIIRQIGNAVPPLLSKIVIKSLVC